MLSSSSSLFAFKSATGIASRRCAAISSSCLTSNYSSIPAAQSFSSPPTSLFCSSSSSSSFLPSPTLFSSKRHLSFKIFVDRDDPDLALRHARELKDKEEHLGRKFGTRYLHALINVAVAHYHKEDYAMARRCALYAHDMIIQHRDSRNTLVYFSATTCSHCTRGLARHLTRILEKRKEIGNAGCTFIDEDLNSSMLATSADEQRRGKSFESIETFVEFLHADANRFDRIAKRIINAPDKYFMKTDEQHRQANCEEGSEGPCSSSDFSNAQQGGSASSAGGGGRSKRKTTTRGEGDGAGGARRRTYDDEVKRSRVKEAEAAYNEQYLSSKHYKAPKHRVNTARHKGKPITTLMRVVR